MAKIKAKKVIKNVRKIKSKKEKTKLPDKVLKYLEAAKIKHKILQHKTVYTAMDAAATMKRKLNEVAKSLLVAADKDYFLVILPADQNLDFNKLNRFLAKQFKKKFKAIKIPGEKIMEEVFKIKAGTLSAFGKLHNLSVIMDKSLMRAGKAVFASGSFNHSVEMAVRDFVKLENVMLGAFGVKKKIKLPVFIKGKIKNNKMKKKKK